MKIIIVPIKTFTVYPQIIWTILSCFISSVINIVDIIYLLYNIYIYVISYLNIRCLLIFIIYTTVDNTRLRRAVYINLLYILDYLLGTKYFIYFCFQPQTREYNIY